MSDTKEQQSSKMNSMLTKIESILTTPISQTLNLDSNVQKPNLNDININKENEKEDDTVADLTTSSSDTTTNTSDSSKIDLGRMESLLKGM